MTARFPYFRELAHRVPPPQKYVYGWDTETFRFGPGLMAPPLVCLSHAGSFTPAPGGDLGALRTVQSEILDDTDGAAWFWAMVQNPLVTLTAHNAAYDVLVMVMELVRRGHDYLHVMTTVLNAYEAGRIRCTLVRQKLIDIAHGEHKFYRDKWKRMQKTTHDLARTALRRLDTTIEKEDTWRLRYGELYGLDPKDYPPTAREYALKDAKTHLDVFWDQEKEIEDDLCPGFMPNEVEQTCSAFALHLMGAYGFRADPIATAKLKAEHVAIRDKAYAKLLTWGLVKPKEFRCGHCDKLVTWDQELYAFKHRPFKNGKCPVADKVEWKKMDTADVTGGKFVKNMEGMRQVVFDLYTGVGEDVPMTEGGSVATDKETLELFDQWTDDDKPIDGYYDERVEAWLESQGNVLSTWIPALEAASRVPAHPRYNVLVESGRTSCSGGGGENGAYGANVQNPPKKGGVRECVIPRTGFVFVFADYDTIELKTLAQTNLELFGYSMMAEALNRGEDLHSASAADEMGLSYEEYESKRAAGDVECEDSRNRQKPKNFGFPGGLGATTFKAYAKGYGLILDDIQAKAAQDHFKKLWPEMVDYFRFISDATEADVPLIHPRSNRVCGRVRYTKRANGYFQGRAADGAKEALWALVRECYLGEDTVGDLNGARSPLFGSRPTLFLHDEFGLECPEGLAHECAERLKLVMEAAMQVWIPDIPAKATAVVVRRWFKGAKPVKVNGRFVPGKPEKFVGEDGKKKVKWVPDLRPQMAMAA